MEVPAVNVEPAPDVSQYALTVHERVVRLAVPEVPPVMVTFDTVTVDAFAVRMPEFPMAMAPRERRRLLVPRVVVPAPPWTVRVPDQRRALAAMVKETFDAPELNVTLPLNSGVRFPKVIVCEDDALNVIGAAKLHDAEVDELVHVPESVQVPAPVAVMYPEALFTLTFPATETVEAFVRRMPAAPLTVSPPPIVNA